MLVGRLYNAGLNRRALSETFDFDLKTIQRWGAVLRSEDAEELLRVLGGRRAGRKLTPQIEAYVRLRWPVWSFRRSHPISLLTPDRPVLRLPELQEFGTGQRSVQFLEAIRL